MNLDEAQRRIRWTTLAVLVGLALILTALDRTGNLDLAVLSLVLGVSAILIPAYLIGVCASAEMICNMLMRPTLLFAGILVVAASVVALLYLRGDEPGALDAGAAGQVP